MKSKYISKDYTQTQLAYLAGIIDGEGSIYIGCYSINPKTGTPHYQTKIEVTNTSEQLIDWLIRVFDGNKTKYTPAQTPKNSRRPVFRWTIWSDHVRHLCELMMPYFVIKKRQAEIMVAMRKTFESTHMQKGQQGTQPIEKEILDLRASLYLEMKSLHIR